MGPEVMQMAEEGEGSLVLVTVGHSLKWLSARKGSSHVEVYEKLVKSE